MKTSEKLGSITLALMVAFLLSVAQGLDAMMFWTFMLMVCMAFATGVQADIERKDK